MDTSDLIAFGSLLTSIVAIFVSIMSDRRSRKLDIILKEMELQKNNKQLEEEKKADIEVYKTEAPRGKLDELKFYNNGKAEALNVSFEIITDPEDEIILRMQENYLPYPKLSPGQYFDIAYINTGTKPH